MNTDKAMQEIDQKIQSEYAAYQNAKYFGALPKGLIEYFKKAIVEVAPNSHQLNTKTILKIAKKKESELTMVEVGLTINAILAAPAYILSDTFFEAVGILEKIEAVRIEYNLAVKKKESELIQRKATLVNLAGATNGNNKFQMVN